MDKLIKEVIEKVVHIAYDFYRVDKSELTLLKESGYFELHEQISENEIMEVLKNHPNLIAEWLQLSEDSRSSVRWGLSRNDNGRYVIGHWPGGEGFEEISSTDKFYACAVFIKRHIESMRILNSTSL